MHDLIPTHALGGASPLNAAIGEVSLVEEPGLALASVTARAGQARSCADRLTQVIGCAPPGPGRAAGADLDALWTGPEQWMIAAALPRHEHLAHELQTALGATASITEQTDAWVVIRLEGGPVVDMLERLCPAPSRRMETGAVQRTSIDHLGCFLWCREAARVFHVLGPRSAALSLHHALITAARSIA